VFGAPFNCPPPPLPEFYVGPARFDALGQPPLPCCVTVSMFSYYTPRAAPARGERGGQKDPWYCHRID